MYPKNYFVADIGQFLGDIVPCPSLISRLVMHFRVSIVISVYILCTLCTVCTVCFQNLPVLDLTLQFLLNFNLVFL